MLIAGATIAALLVIAALVPMLPLAHGIVRIGDFPRQQFLAVACIVFVALFLFSQYGPALAVTEGALGAVALLQAWYILPFTPMWRKQSAGSDGEDGCAVRIVSSNVKMSNDRYADLAAEVGRADPDLVIFMEVDQKWVEGLAPLLKRYPHVIARQQENSYGMVLASRFELSDTQVTCLLTKRVPSIITVVTTPGGRRFRLYAIHPEPPVPNETSKGRDGETALAAMKARSDDLPVLVSGDLNDVAWSRTTARFRRISQLLDPRVGRRVFSTFDARYPLMRWPLDHLFHSAHFRFTSMKRLKPCGSDHFPVAFELKLCDQEYAIGRPPVASRLEVERAQELVAEARERDDAPIGEDWEK